MDCQCKGIVHQIHCPKFEVPDYSALGVRVSRDAYRLAFAEHNHPPFTPCGENCPVVIVKADAEKNRR